MVEATPICKEFVFLCETLGGPLVLAILIRNAKTLSSDKLVSILIEDERISEIATEPSAGADREIDAQGALVLPTFVEPHVHLDKVLLSEDFGFSSSIGQAREIIKRAKESFTVSTVKERIKKVMPLALKQGVTVIRSQVDIDPIVELKSLNALNEVRREYSGRVDLQVVVNPQEGIINQEGTEDLLYKAFDSGADVMGGLPEAEVSIEESKEHLDTVFSIAKEKDVDVDVHNDVLSFGRNLEYFLAKVIRNHYGGRASSAHNIALAYYSDDYASKIIGLIKRANVSIVTNPCTMMTSGGLHPPPMPRGITRVKELLTAGVNVTYGIDNMVDPFNPFGDFSALRNGWLLAYAGQLNARELFEKIPRMITENAARMLRLTNYGIAKGSVADINVLNCSSVADALRFGDIPRYVIKRGNVLAENQSVSKLYT
jgi:cytosine deaminase